MLYDYNKKILNSSKIEGKKIFKNLEENLESCTYNNMKVFFAEFFKRIYMPLFIPLLALTSSLLVLRSKDDFRYNSFKNIIFLIGIFFIVFSEITVRYFGVDMKNNIFFLFLPLILFVLIYSSIFIFSYRKFN